MGGDIFKNHASVGGMLVALILRQKEHMESARSQDYVLAIED
jgi:hypothetical protein